MTRFSCSDLADPELLKAADDCSDECQITLFESHLCRCLRKPAEQQQAAVNKYKGLYATVKPSALCNILWEFSQAVSKDGPKAAEAKPAATATGVVAPAAAKAAKAPAAAEADPPKKRKKAGT